MEWELLAPLQAELAIGREMSHQVLSDEEEPVLVPDLR